MKTLLFALLFTACGDNIIGYDDAGVDAPGHVHPDPAPDCGIPPADAPVDAAMPDAPEPEKCVDPHTGGGTGHVINCDKHTMKQ